MTNSSLLQKEKTQLAITESNNIWSVDLVKLTKQPQTQYLFLSGMSPSWKCKLNKEIDVLHTFASFTYTLLHLKGKVTSHKSFYIVQISLGRYPEKRSEPRSQISQPGFSYSHLLTFRIVRRQSHCYRRQRHRPWWIQRRSSADPPGWQPNPASGGKI